MNNLERFRRGEIVLHTPTQELYDRLMQWCDEEGLRWGYSNNQATHGSYYSTFNESTYVTLKYQGLMYSSILYNGTDTIVTLTNKDFEEEHQMTKEDLKVGQVVETKDNAKHVLVKNNDIEVLYQLNNDDFMQLDDFSDDLTNDYDDDFNITKVYTTSDLVSVLSGNYDSLELIWTRENPEVTAMKANVAKMEAELENMKENLRKMEEV
jgi:hypothetical protein